MVHVDDPTSGTVISPVIVQLAPKGWQQEVYDTVKKQGPLALALLVAVWFVWQQWQVDRESYETRQAARELVHAETARTLAKESSTAVERMAVQQTQQLKNQAEVFISEQSRTERILGRRIDRNQDHIDAVAAKVEKIAPPE